MLVRAARLMPALAALLLGACADHTAVLVTIDGRQASPPIVAPDDVDILEVAVAVDGEGVWEERFVLAGAAAPVQESLTLRPGSRASGAFRLRVAGLHGADEVALGTALTAFEPGALVEVTVELDWLGQECADGDGDGFGRGPGCQTPDCDDQDPQVYPGARERCNEADDDCDGAVDEGCGCSAGETRPCAGPDEGICDPGAQQCEQVGGEWGWGEACDGAVPPLEAELCNGLDDDCDGDSDEDFDLLGDVAHCGSCDRACSFDHGSGLCQGGQCVVTGCEPGYHDRNDDPSDGCEYPCTPTVPPDEVCDGDDNDCDGYADNLAGAPPCALVLGVCAGSTQTCDGTGGWLPCGADQYGPHFEQVELSCDGRDNDCDGLTDGADPDLQPPPCELDIGVCAGAQHAPSSCTSGGWQPCGVADYGSDYEQAETRCDGLDNDCDGLTDDDDPDLTPPSCPLTQGVCAGATRSCLGTGGWGDCDYGPSYQAVDTTCDGLDNDCDGQVWGSTGNAVWTQEVSVPGDSCNPYQYTGGISIAAAPGGRLGVAWSCFADPDIRAAVLDAQGNVLWRGVAIALDGLWGPSPRIAAIGSNAFLVYAEASGDAAHGDSPVFRIVDQGGPANATSFGDGSDILCATLATAPWDSSRALALWVDSSTAPDTTYVRLLNSTPALLDSDVAVGLSPAPSNINTVNVELLATPAGALAIVEDSALDALQARWITGPPPTVGAAFATWQGLDFSSIVSALRIRGAVNETPTGHTALVAAVLYDDFPTTRTALYLADVGATSGAPLLEADWLSSVIEAAPVSVVGGGLAVVALRTWPDREVVWMASGGSLADLAQVGDAIASDIDGVDAVATGNRNVAIAMIARDDRVMVQLRYDACTP